MPKSGIVNRQIGVKNFIWVVILDLPTKGHVVQRIITNPRWRTAAILKIAKYHISVKNRAILIKFGTLQQILNPMIVTWPKIFKIQDGGGRHRENRLFGHNSSTIVRFQRNFVWGSRTACRQVLHDKNCKFLKSKMADGRHFENR